MAIKWKKKVLWKTMVNVRRHDGVWSVEGELIVMS